MEELGAIDITYPYDTSAITREMDGTELTTKLFIKSIENNSLIVTLLGGGIIFTLFRYIGEIFTFLKDVILNIISFEIVGVYTVHYNEPSDLKRISYLIDKKSHILWNKKFQLSKKSQRRRNNFQ